jgi:hypothetical protein
VITRIAASALLVGAALLTGCAAQPDDDEDSGIPAIPDGASAEHIAALADREVTEEEYTAGYRRFAACMDDAGYPLHEMGRPSTVYEAGVAEIAMDLGVYDECYDTEFKVIDIVWQTENPPWTEAGERMQDCLAAEGLPTDGTEPELQDRMREHGLDVSDCLLGIDRESPTPAP